MVELLLNILQDDPESWDLRVDALKVIETVLRDAGSFANEVKEFLDTNVVQLLPPEPPDPKVAAEMERQRLEEEAKEAERLRKEEEAAAAAAAKLAPKEEEPAAVNGIPEGPLKNPNLDKLADGAGSRRGSASSVILGGTSRRGSYYGDDISNKATVALVVDDPESKKKINALLGEEGRHSQSFSQTIIYLSIYKSNQTILLVSRYF